MKKVVIILFIAVTIVLPLSAYDFMQLLLGRVGLMQELVFELDQSVVPINMDSPDVNKDPGETPRGKRIGQYSFVSNSNSFSLIITHTPLVCQTNSGSFIDYRLYFFTSDSAYISCLSSSATNANEETDTQKKMQITGSVLEIVNQSVYINFENYDSQNNLNTGTVLNGLTSGTYSSTIKFYLEYT